MHTQFLIFGSFLHHTSTSYVSLLIKVEKVQYIIDRVVPSAYHVRLLLSRHVVHCTGWCQGREFQEVAGAATRTRTVQLQSWLPCRPYQCNGDMRRCSWQRVWSEWLPRNWSFQCKLLRPRQQEEEDEDNWWWRARGSRPLVVFLFTIILGETSALPVHNTYIIDVWTLHIK